MPRRDNRYWNQRDGTLMPNGQQDRIFNHVPQVGDNVGGRNATRRDGGGFRPDRYRPLNTTPRQRTANRVGSGRVVPMSLSRSGMRPGRTSTMGRR